MTTLSTQQRIDMIKQVGEEIISVDDLKALMDANTPLVAYDGFEPSGRIHIAQGLLRAININKMLKAGCTFKMWVADWHAWANNKMGGDLHKIKVTGEYFIEVWKACGLDTSKVQFLWVSDMVKDDEYWKLVMKIARINSLKRIIRTSQIMGRSESDDLTAAQILYPCMQCADIFYLGVNVCQLGMDQRKVNMLAREVAEELGYKKPVCVHHHMLMGLTPPKVAEGVAADSIEAKVSMKMSKSNPASAIFMTDSQKEIEDKFAKAYCPANQITENPVLEYFRYIIFEMQPTVTIERPEKFGGTVSFDSYGALEEAYGAGKIHPLDLKKTCAASINRILEPIRAHFASDPRAKDLKDQVDSFIVTR